MTIEMVKTYFGGRAEAKSFAVADHAIFGRAAKALEELRWALDGGTAPVLVTSAVAGGLRGLAKFKAAPRGMREGDLMREVGVPSWKLETLRDQAHGWDERRHRPRHPRRGGSRRRDQGPRPRRVVRAREDGARRRALPQPSLR